jgi:ADP-L-glycero-D-manno-heptose 6-epimerase
MLVVTGGAGFIGSNLVRALNAAGRSDILVVDDLRDAHKVLNLADCRIADYLDLHDFQARISAGQELAPKIEGIFHQGACTDTTEWDGLLMMRANYEYSKQVLHYATARKLPLVYASSASVYGAGREFRVSEDCERPINVYAFSKLMFDRHVRQLDGHVSCAGHRPALLQCLRPRRSAQGQDGQRHPSLQRTVEGG